MTAIDKRDHHCTTDQGSPVGVEVAYPEGWDELSQGHHQEIQIEEEAELLEQHLQRTHTQNTEKRKMTDGTFRKTAGLDCRHFFLLVTIKEPPQLYM